ncbi:MAG: NEW3 domain-containing protein [Acidobacteriota bacterium]
MSCSRPTFRLACCTVILTAFLTAPRPTFSQTSTFFNQRDDQYRLLGLKRAKEAYEIARTELQRQQRLFEAGQIPQSALDKQKQIFSDAEVNYQQSLLAVLFEQQYVSVEQAVKYQSQEGRKRVRLVLNNRSGGGREFRKLLGLDDALFRSLQPDVINDVYVSLMNDQDAIISQPYESKIEVLRYGKPVTLDFGLLQDVNTVSVNLIYGNGTQSRRKILLQKDATFNKVVIQSQPFSQEAELGHSATFGLNMELFSGENSTFKLEVVNLPAAINRYFEDPDGKARLSQIKFTEGNNTRQASLSVFLPDRPGDEVHMDESLVFYVLAVPQNDIQKTQEDAAKKWTLDEIKGINAGYARLELTPRGVGRIQVRMDQLYYGVTAGQAVQTKIHVSNEGSRRLDNIRISTDLPLDWTADLEPAVLPALEIGSESAVRLNLTPPDDATVGKFEIQIHTISMSDNKTIEGEDKTLTVEIKPASSILRVGLIMLFMLGLILVIIAFGIRLARR